MVRIRSDQNDLSRIIFTLAGTIIFFFGLNAIIQLNNTISYIIALGSIYLIFDSVVSILMQLRETAQFQIGRVIRGLIGIINILIVLNYDLTFTEPLELRVLDLSLIVIGIFLISYGIFFKLKIREKKSRKRGR